MAQIVLWDAHWDAPVSRVVESKNGRQNEDSQGIGRVLSLGKPRGDFFWDKKRESNWHDMALSPCQEQSTTERKAREGGLEFRNHNVNKTGLKKKK